MSGKRSYRTGGFRVPVAEEQSREDRFPKRHIYLLSDARVSEGG